MRFENIDEDPAPKDVAISYFCQNEKALQVGLVGHPDLPMIQEPSWVELPDKRLFCVMRTTLGSPYYSVSENGGEATDKLDPFKPIEGKRPVIIPAGSVVKKGTTPGGEGPYNGNGGADETLHENPLPPGSVGEWRPIPGENSKR